MRFSDILVVVAGAGIGGGLRYALGTWLAERWGTSFPWHTFAVNVSGAFVLGVLMALSAERGMLPGAWRLFLAVGIMGGYTTFSTLSYESVALLERGLWGAGALNMFGSGLVGLAAAYLGMFVGRQI